MADTLVPKMKLFEDFDFQVQWYPHTKEYSRRFHTKKIGVGRKVKVDQDILLGILCG